MGCGCDVYFLRQCIVHFANCMLSLGTGFMLSFPAVLNPDILSANSTGIYATPDQASWIASSNGWSGVIGFCLMPYIMQLYGRKLVHIGLNFFAALGFIMFVFAYNVPFLYAARMMQGIPMCEVFITAIIVAEYSHPKRRGYFITIKKSLVAIGSLLCHSLALCWTWKHIAAFAVIPNVLAIVFTFIWPESPSYLALIGKYEECDKSHKWLFGDGLNSKRDLELLVSSQKESRQATNKINFNTVIRKLFKKDFVKPFIIVSLLTVITDASGRYYMLAYVVQILTEVTKDKSVAVYCTIGSDILTLLALIISCFVIRCCKRRTLLFISGTICVSLMCLTSLVTFLKSHYDLLGSVYLWLTPLVILLNVFVVNVGVVPACFAITCEIFPLEHKGTGTCATGIVFTVLYALIMKCTPLLMEKTGVEGTFGVYAIHVIVCLLILYFILNETKDKTLQEIENEMKGVKKSSFNEYYLNEKPLIE